MSEQGKSEGKGKSGRYTRLGSHDNAADAITSPTTVKPGLCILYFFSVFSSARLSIHFVITDGGLLIFGELRQIRDHGFVD